MTDTSLAYRTLTSLASAIRKGEISSVEITENCLARIDLLDDKLNAFRIVCRDRSLAQAKAAEIALKAGQDLGPLHGIPYAAKDLFDVKELPTTAGTSVLKANIAQEDATTIHRLARAGMILVGKTNTVQFAYSGIGINHDHGTPHNPWHANHYIPGGSSSGSAVAVSSGMVPVALGTDTGGSVRIPAGLCGLVGLKTTVGRVSRAGVYPLSWSLDSVGPIGRSVEDVALMYQCMNGPDLKDETTLKQIPHDVLKGLRRGVKGLRLAFAESVFWDEATPDVEKAVRECGNIFKNLGATVERIQFQEAEEVKRLNPGGLIIAAEAYTINKDLLEQHIEELDLVVSFRIEKGKEISAHEYLQNTLTWKKLREQTGDTLKDIDALLVPTTAIPALPVEEVDVDIDTYSEKNLLYLRNTSIGNILNLCGLSVPCGFSKEGLPIGLMIYGKSFHEDMVLRIGHAFQEATNWHQQTPDLTWAE